MALQNFIQTIWIAGIMKALQKQHVFASVANTDYQGQLNNLGDRVQINMIGDVSVSQYSKDADIASPTDIQDAASELIADQAYYFNFKTNDVEAVQQKTSLLTEATNRAAYSFRDVVDQYFAGLHTQAGLHSYSTGTTPWDVTSLNVEDVLMDAKEKLGVANVPEAGRYLIVPEWFHTKLVFAGLATKTSNDEVWANGFVGKVLGFDIYKSNNVAQTNPLTGDHAKIFGGIKGQSLSFAQVIAKIEAYRPEKRFEDAVKGLYVFGGKVIRPDMTIILHCDKTAEA
ncbi:phage major capsid protein [Immundisolibacter sp.]